MVTVLVLDNTAYLSAPLLSPVVKASDILVTFKYIEPYPSIVQVEFIPILTADIPIPFLIVNLLLLIKSDSLSNFKLPLISCPLV